MTFKIGMKVVCVDAVQHGRYTPWPHGKGMHGLTEGVVYTIRALGDFEGTPGCVWLHEIHRPLVGCVEFPYALERFRPAVSPKQEVSFTTGAPLDSEQWDNRKRVDEPAWGATQKETQA